MTPVKPDIDSLLLHARQTLNSTGLDAAQAQRMAERLMGAVALPVAPVVTTAPVQATPSQQSFAVPVGVGVQSNGQPKISPKLSAGRLIRFFFHPDGGTNWLSNLMVLGFVAVVFFALKQLTTQMATETASGGTAALDATSLDLPFFSLVPQDELMRHQSSARVVSVEVPHLWLASYGVPTAPEQIDRAVRVDWLVSANGDKLAMRVLE